MLDLGIKSYAALTAKEEHAASGSGNKVPATPSINEHTGTGGMSASRLSTPGSLSSASSFESLAELEENAEVEVSEGKSGLDCSLSTPEHRFAGGHADHFQGSGVEGALEEDWSEEICVPPTAPPSLTTHDR